jgi:protein-L-isoaspartate O-methyltransferase
VIPVGEGAVQHMLVVVRTAQDSFERQEHGEFKFVPMLTDRV